MIEARNHRSLVLAVLLTLASTSCAHSRAIAQPSRLSDTELVAWSNWISALEEFVEIYRGIDDCKAVTNVGTFERRSSWVSLSRARSARIHWSDDVDVVVLGTSTRSFRVADATRLVGDVHRSNCALADAEFPSDAAGAPTARGRVLTRNVDVLFVWRNGDQRWTARSYLESRAVLDAPASAPVPTGRCWAFDGVSWLPEPSCEDRIASLTPSDRRRVSRAVALRRGSGVPGRLLRDIEPFERAASLRARESTCAAFARAATCEAGRADVVTPSGHAREFFVDGLPFWGLSSEDGRPIESTVNAAFCEPLTRDWSCLDVLAIATQARLDWCTLRENYPGLDGPLALDAPFGPLQSARGNSPQAIAWRCESPRRGSAIISDIARTVDLRVTPQIHARVTRVRVRLP